MCDTIFVPASRVRSGSAIFAKNSDRNPDEPQVMTLSTAGRWPCLLSRPVWMKGAEMGINAHGVVIGNEAVFSRWKPAPDGVLGMDILRLALEESATAEDAVDFIAHFTETRTQGGNGAYKGKLFYDNSYLVADFTEAWVLETAGHRWAARRTAGPAAISNSYSLTDDFDTSDPQTAAEKSPGYSWKRRVESRTYGFITKGDFRRACSLGRVGSDGMTLEGVLSAMRSHGPHGMKGMRSVCMHGGGMVNNATTASMAVELLPERRAVIWFTASPSPCLSLYKPAVLENGSFCPLWIDYDYTEGSQSATEYWKRRRLAAAPLQRRAPRDPQFASRRDAAQGRLAELLAARSGPSADARLIRDVSAIVKAFEE
jgi:secernin